VGVGGRLAPTFAPAPWRRIRRRGPSSSSRWSQGPIPAFQHWLPIVVLALILGGAMVALQRSIPRELPADDPDLPRANLAAHQF